MRINRPAQRTSTTDDHASNLLGRSPMPTQAPWMNELVKRQNYPITCGYINADRENAQYCELPGHACVVDELGGFLGCCPFDDIANCGRAQQCRNVFRSNDCDAQCQSNTDIVKCTSGTCGKVVYDFGTTEYIGFHCSHSRNITAYPTYTNPLSDEEISVSPLIMGEFKISLSDISDLDPSTSDTSTSTSELLTPDFQSSKSTPGTSNGDGGSDDGVNVGAIVGGAIGGLVIIAIIAIVYILLRHRRQKRRDTLTAQAGGGGATTAITGTAANPHDSIISKAEMPVQEGKLSPEQSRYGSVAMSTSDSTMIDGMSPVSPDRFRHELSPINNDA